MLKKGRRALSFAARTLVDAFRSTLTKKFKVKLLLATKIAKVWTVTHTSSRDIVSETLLDAGQLGELLHTPKLCRDLVLIQLHVPHENSSIEIAPLHHDYRLCEHQRVHHHSALEIGLKSESLSSFSSSTSCSFFEEHDDEEDYLKEEVRDQEEEEEGKAALLREIRVIVSAVVKWIESFSRKRVTGASFSFLVQKRTTFSPDDWNFLPTLTGVSKLSLVEILPPLLVFEDGANREEVGHLTIEKQRRASVLSLAQSPLPSPLQTPALSAERGFKRGKDQSSRIQPSLIVPHIRRRPSGGGGSAFFRYKACESGSFSL